MDSLDAICLFDEFEQDDADEEIEGHDGKREVVIIERKGGCSILKGSVFCKVEEPPNKRVGDRAKKSV